MTSTWIHRQVQRRIAEAGGGEDGNGADDERTASFALSNRLGSRAGNMAGKGRREPAQLKKNGRFFSKTR